VSIEFQTGKISSSPSLVEQGRHLFDWWIDELRALVPASLMARAPNQRRCDVDLLLTADGNLSARNGDDSPMQISYAELDQILEAFAQSRKPVSISLDVPVARCLVRKSVVPRQALRDVRNILSYELTENTPLKPDSVFSDWFVEGEDPTTHTLHLRHVVLAHTHIAPVLSALDHAGLSLTRLTVGHGEERPLPVDLLSATDAGLRGFLQSLSVPARLLWGVALAVLVAMPFLFIDRAGRELAGLADERTLAMSALAKGPALDNASLKAAADLSAIPSLRSILDDVSVRQPTSVYYTAINFNGGHLSLLLGGGDAATARQALQDSPLFDLQPAVTADGNAIELELKHPHGEGLAHD
jgi:hypothetical protein